MCRGLDLSLLRGDRRLRVQLAVRVRCLCVVSALFVRCLYVVYTLFIRCVYDVCTLFVVSGWLSSPTLTVSCNQ